MPVNIGNTTVGGLSDDADGVGAVDVKELDMLLPIANVGRIMKQILPSNAKISKEAKETMQECVSEFISFVTGEASEKCRKERRKTVTSEDICWAMGALGFDDYVGPLKRYLQRYRESEGEHHRANNQERANNSSGEAEDDRGIARTTQAGASSSSHKVGRSNTMAYGSRPF